MVAVLPDTLADVESDTFHHTLGNMEAKRRDHPQAATLAGVGLEKVGDTFGNV